MSEEYEVAQKAAETAKCFVVAAGKPEPDGETNWKFVSDYLTLPEAVAEAEACRGYPIVEVTCQGYVIESWTKL